MSIKLNARDLLDYSKDQLWSIPDTEITVVFDDGELVSTGRKTILSVYLWEIHRQWRKTPLLKHHHIGERMLSSKLYLDILSDVYKDWYYTYDGVSRESVWKLIYETTNNVYNDFITNLGEYVMSLNILDFLDVLDHPTIKEAQSKVRPTQASIDDMYDIIKDVLFNDVSLDKNPIAIAAKSSLVDLKQVNQCLGPRGFTTEIDSTIFKEPIVTGFATGIRSLYGSMIESRSASKALSYQKNPLAMCEYFNRKLQQIGQSVLRLHPGDCGSQHTWAWKIEPNELKALDGIKYLDNGVVKTIRSTDLSLVGQVLNIRTPFGCIHPDNQGICETCHGDMSLSIPYGTVPGHEAAISIGEKTSQLVLSTKHVEGSSKVDDIDLGEVYGQYLVPGSEDNTLKLHSDLKGIKIVMEVSNQFMKSLPDIANINNLDDINVGRITEIDYVKFYIGEGDEMHEMTVPTAMGSRKGSLTADALYYIKEYSYDFTDSGDYLIDLSYWDPNRSLFELPLKHINMLDFQDQVEKVILSTDKKIGLSRYTSKNNYDPVLGVKSLLALINSKLNLNLSHILTISYAVSAVDPKNGNFNLPRGGQLFEFASISQIMPGRSIGATMAFQGQEGVFLKPETYIVKDRPAHPLDDLLLGK